MDNIFLEEFQKVEFTKNQKKIAQYCMDHQYEVCQETLSEFAAHVGVTEVTVLNFVRKLGYTGFADFKNHAFTRLSEQMHFQRSSLSERMKENSLKNNSAQPIDTYLKLALDTVEQSLIQNPQESYHQAVDWMVHANQVLVFGARSTSTNSEHFARMLTHLLPRVLPLPADLSLTMLTVSGASSADVLVLFCKKRYYKSDIALCKLANAVGLRVILITDSILAPVAPYADLILLAKVNGVSFFDSAIGITAIQEYLTQLVSERAEDDVKKRWEITDLYTDDSRF